MFKHTHTHLEEVRSIASCKWGQREISSSTDRICLLQWLLPHQTRVATWPVHRLRITIVVWSQEPGIRQRVWFQSTLEAGLAGRRQTQPPDCGESSPAHRGITGGPPWECNPSVSGALNRGKILVDITVFTWYSEAGRGDLGNKWVKSPWKGNKKPKGWAGAAEVVKRTRLWMILALTHFLALWPDVS